MFSSEHEMNMTNKQIGKSGLISTLLYDIIDQADMMCIF